MHFFLQSFTSTQPLKTAPLTRAQELMEDIANSNAIDNKAYKKLGLCKNNKQFLKIKVISWKPKTAREAISKENWFHLHAPKLNVK